MCAELGGAQPTVAYVVMCHHKPDQALRLARTIVGMSDRARVLLRHDRPPGFIDDEQARSAGAELLVSGIEGRWGHWSLVEAALEAFAVARERFAPAWTVLVSGQDYPVRRLDEWERELLDGAYDAIVAGTPVVRGPLGLRLRDPDDAVRMRYTHRWRRLPRPGLVTRLPQPVRRVGRAVWYRYLFALQAVVVLNELPRDNGWALGVRRRVVPFSPDTPGYKGEQWVALSERAVGATLAEGRAATWREYFRQTLIPDEAFFATVLAERPDVRVRAEGVSWLRWSTEVTEPHPLTMTPALVDEAAASGRPFARKFDEARAPGLLDAVDANLLSGRHAA